MSLSKESKEVLIYTVGVLVGVLVLYISVKDLPEYQKQSDRKEMDYSIDIYDPGDGTIRLKDLRDGEMYVIPFDSLEEKIMMLNL